MSHPSTATESGVPTGAPLLRVLALIIAVTGSVLIGIAYPASAVPSPGGSVSAGQSCQGWSVKVELNHKVAPFRIVDVISTIPGHPGITNGTFDSSFGEIWMASGSAHDISGSVTLRISAGTSPIFEAAAALVPAEGCEAVTSSSSASSSTTTTTTSTTTTTLAGMGGGMPGDPAARADGIETPTEFAATGLSSRTWGYIGLGFILLGVAGLVFMWWPYRKR